MRMGTSGTPSIRSNEMLTQKQYAIMSVIVRGNGNDARGKLIPIDMDELLERVSYKTTKDSMQFSLRALIKRKILKKGPVEQRRGRRRRTFIATELGRSLVTVEPKREHFVEPIVDDPLLTALSSLSEDPFPPEEVSS